MDILCEICGADEKVSYIFEGDEMLYLCPNCAENTVKTSVKEDVELAHYKLVSASIDWYLKNEPTTEEDLKLVALIKNYLELSAEFCNPVP